jgi:hypothetical protein
LKYGSNVPFARSCILLAINECHMDRKARDYCLKALRWMHRRKAVRRSPAKGRRITADQKRRVKAMVHSELSQHEIANAVGITNSGRVSEIMGGLR